MSLKQDKSHFRKVQSMANSKSTQFKNKIWGGWCVDYEELQNYHYINHLDKLNFAF